MVWGTPGFTERLEGASGKAWELTFERRLAPRPGHAENPASSVWLVRAADDSRFYAAKRQNVTVGEVEALVDEAAAWRKSSLDCDILAELVDVFVIRESPCSVTFLHEFCARGHIPKRAPSEPVLLTIISDLSEAAAAVYRATGTALANISYDTVLVDDTGRAKLIGFGAKRSACVAHQSPSPENDVVDIAEFIFLLVTGRPLRGAPPPQDVLPYEPRLVELVESLLDAHASRILPGEASARARELGAESKAPVIDVSERATGTDGLTEAISDNTPVAPDVQRAVEKLTSGVDAGGAYSAVLSGLERDAMKASKALFKTLYNCPIANDPLCTMRALTMLHNVMLDGPEDLLESVRVNDKFLDWVESTWTKDAVRAVVDGNSQGDNPHPACASFEGGELAFYTKLLRLKARFHMLAAGGFSGAWERTGKSASDGRDVLVTRRRKVVGGMADLAEMASEIGVIFANSTDEETALKHASLRAIVDECCRAFNAAHGLASETKSVKDASKLVPGFSRLWDAARALLSAVKGVRSAGAEDWADQFGDDGPPDIVKEAEFRIRGSAPPEVADDMPESGWEATEKIMGDTGENGMTEKELKKERKRKKKEAEATVSAEADEGEPGDEITAADGAVVVHGADAEAQAAVTTMFGDLLKMDGGDTSELRDTVDPRAARAPGELTDREALAAAFGAPMPTDPGLCYDDDDGDGAYDDYRARQEEAKSASSTGAWAAKSGYGGGALVLHQTVELAPNKPHPAFCQCSLCQQAELQNAAHQAEMRAWEARESEDYRNGYGDRGSRNYDDDFGDGGSYQSVEYDIDDSAEYESRKRGGRDGDEHQYGGATQSPQDIERVLKKELIVNPKKLRMGDKIGEGSFGVVYKGEYQRNVVAIKKMSKKMLASTNAVEEFSNEVYVMCALDHTNVLKCIAASLKPPSVLLVTEFMKRGTLFDVLYKSRIKLTWSMIRKIAIQVVKGMAHMHERGIIHRDLKSGNVLLDTAYNAKVGDFGLAGPPRPSSNAGACGTYQYMAPEILAGEPHSMYSDVYAFGVLLSEMIAGRPPFDGMEPMQAAQSVLNESARPTIPPHAQRPYVAIIQACWGAAPSARPSFEEVLRLIETTTK